MVEVFSAYETFAVSVDRSGPSGEPRDSVEAGLGQPVDPALGSADQMRSRAAASGDVVLPARPHALHPWTDM